MSGQKIYKPLNILIFSLPHNSLTNYHTPDTKKAKSSSKMSSSTSTSTMDSAHISLIRRDVNAIKTAFSIGGSISLPNSAARSMPLRVFLPGNTFVNLPVSDVNAGLDPLLQACRPATYGLNSEDVLDKSYRDALQLQASEFAINFNLAEHGILAQIRRLMVPHFKDIRAELYNINVYERNGHFKSHRDTPREDMFGSLVVCLPSRFEGGQMFVRHKDIEQTYDWSDKQSQELVDRDKDKMVGSSSTQSSSDKENITCHWAAFFSDCEHEITPVSLGHRITITYNLYPVIPQNISGVVEKNSISMSGFEITQQAFYKTLHQALSSKDFMPEGGIIGFCMEHSYPLTDSKFKADYGSLLKGGDAVVYFAMRQLGMDIKLRAVYTSSKCEANYMNEDPSLWDCDYDRKCEDYNFDNDREDRDDMNRDDMNRDDMDREDRDDMNRDDMNRDDTDREDGDDNDVNKKNRKIGEDDEKYISSHFKKRNIAFGDDQPGADFEIVCREYLKTKNGRNVIWITQPTVWEHGLTSTHFGNCAQIDAYYVAAAMLVKVPKWGEECRKEKKQEIYI